MSKKYNIFLSHIKIGSTFLEKADAPMGVVFGKMIETTPDFGYQFLKEYCKKENIEFDDFPQDRLILTRTIRSLKVVNESGTEIIGIGNQITGMDSEGFEVSIEGIAYPFFEEEFPEHVKAEQDRFK